MRFVFFADLHLDTAFGWAPPAVAHRRRQSLRDALVAVVDLADEVDADAILCGGDLYEHDRFTPDTVAFVRDTLGSAGRRVFLAPGNHDWLGPGSLYVQAAWSDGVHVFQQDRLERVELEHGLTLWGAAHRAPANTDGFLDHGFRVDGEGVHLALFHGSERGWFRFEGEGKRPHAPFDAAQVDGAGLHHVFAGHYHTPRHDQRLTYPGNPDPLSFGEQGERGAVVADIAEDGSVVCKWHDVARSNVSDVTIDVTGCASRQDVRDLVAQRLAPLAGCVRLTIDGDLPPEVELRLADLPSATPHLDFLAPRKGDLHVAYDFDAIATEQTVRGQFVKDVLASPDLDEDERQRILVTGLRALEGRDDLEVE